VPVTAEAEPLTDNLFVDELMSVLEDAFPSGLEAPSRAQAAAPPQGGAQIVVSPLFRHFSVDEMVAVIAGLNLLTFQRGQVILREGEPGHSLFMLSSGKVKAFRKGAGGKQVPIAVLEEGAFFGEGSILTGKPRTASIVALEECELLELDRATLDCIVSQHPHVMDVMREFAAQRAVAK
jgi:CRP-like cAMP-binding protein